MSRSKWKMRVLVLGLTAVSLISSSNAFAKTQRLFNCEAPQAAGQPNLCVHVNAYDGGKIKIILKDCGNMNSWETYTVTNVNGVFEGVDGQKRQIQAQFADKVGRIVYAKAVDYQTETGFTEIKDLQLTCEAVK